MVGCIVLTSVWTVLCRTKLLATIFFASLKGENGARVLRGCERLYKGKQVGNSFLVLDTCQYSFHPCLGLRFFILIRLSSSYLYTQCYFNLPHLYLSPRSIQMLFFPFTTATAALLSLRSTVASPLDGINESITALFTSTFCFQTVGNGSAAALYNLGNGKESYCTCLSVSSLFTSVEGWRGNCWLHFLHILPQIANTNSSGYSVCPGGEKAACRSTETSSSTGTTITNTCTTCPTYVFLFLLAAIELILGFSDSKKRVLPEPRIHRSQIRFSMQLRKCYLRC